jgi:ribosomal-protein-alanine N-acetyltransferase
MTSTAVKSHARVLKSTSRVPKLAPSRRLSFGKIRLADAEAIYHVYARYEQAARFLTWRVHRDLEETRRFVALMQQRWRAGSEYTWVVRERRSNTIVGAISARKARHGFAIGYVLGPDYWGKGLMLEAVKTVLIWAFKQKLVKRVSAVCDIQNVASAKLLRRAGFQRQRLLRGYAIHPNIAAEPRNCYLYTVHRPRSVPSEMA